MLVLALMEGRIFEFKTPAGIELPSHSESEPHPTVETRGDKTETKISFNQGALGKQKKQNYVALAYTMQFDHFTCGTRAVIATTKTSSWLADINCTKQKTAQLMTMSPLF